MKKKDLRRLRIEVDEAGSPEDKRRVLQSATARLENELVRLGNEMAALRTLFAEKLKAWLSKPVQGTIIPFVLPDDHHAARNFMFAGLAAILFEGGVAVQIFRRAGLSWWWGALVAAATAIVLHGTFLMLWRTVTRPHQTIGKIKRYVLTPSLIVFGLSLIILLLARTVTGWLAITLLPLFGVGLWTVTVGLVGIAGALFAAAHVTDWSYKDKKEYEMVENISLEISLLRDEFVDQLATLATEAPLQLPNSAPAPRPAAPASGAASSASTPSGATVVPGKVLPLVLIAMIGVLSACAGVETAASQSDTEISLAMPRDSVGFELGVVLDFTGSPQVEAYKVFTRILRENLPSLVETDNLRRLIVYQFGADGWDMTQKADITFPAWDMPKPPTRLQSDLDGLPNIEEALRADAESKMTQARKTMRERNLSLTMDAIRSLSDEILVPSADEDARCSDVNGVFEHLRQSAPRSRRVILIATDATESCDGGGIRKIPAPRNDLPTIVIVLPDSERTPAINGARHFQDASEALAKSVPWAMVVPYFTEDLGSVIRMAEMEYARRVPPNDAGMLTSEARR